MLLTAIPNPNYMNGTMGVDSTPHAAPLRPYSMYGTIGLDQTFSSRSAVAVPVSPTATGLSGTIGLNATPQAAAAVANAVPYGEVYGTHDIDGLGGMSGTIGLDSPAQVERAVRNDMRGVLGLDAPAQLTSAIQNNASNRYGMSGTIGLDSTPQAAVAAQNRNPMQGTIGLDGPPVPYGMGTTGSLGVNLTAPYTRGGFRGELFDPAPMPTGYWRNAPAPVMLGTETLPVGTIAPAAPAASSPSMFSSPIVQAVVAGVAFYGLYRLFK
jgi:hypothetical protein